MCHHGCSSGAAVAGDTGGDRGSRRRDRSGDEGMAAAVAAAVAASGRRGAVYLSPGEGRSAGRRDPAAPNLERCSCRGEDAMRAIKLDWQADGQRCCSRERETERERKREREKKRDCGEKGGRGSTRRWIGGGRAAEWRNGWKAGRRRRGWSIDVRGKEADGVWNGVLTSAGWSESASTSIREVGRGGMLLVLTLRGKEAGTGWI